MSDWDEDDTKVVIDRVSAAFAARSKASVRISRCRRPEAVEVARAESEEADRVYRAAAADRDEFMDIRRAQRAQGKIRPIYLVAHRNRGGSD